jgi:hypothetical protein
VTLTILAAPSAYAAILEAVFPLLVDAASQQDAEGHLVVVGHGETVVVTEAAHSAGATSVHVAALPAPPEVAVEAGAVPIEVTAPAPAYMLSVQAPAACHPAIVAALRPFDIVTCEPSGDAIDFGLSLGDGAQEAAHNAGARVVSFGWIEVPAVVEAVQVENVTEADIVAADADIAEATRIDETVEAAEAAEAIDAAIDAEATAAIEEVVDAEAAAEAEEAVLVIPEEEPVAFCVRLTGSSRAAIVEDGLILCRCLAGSVEFDEPPTAWDGGDWTIRGTGRLSAVQVACVGVEGASVSAP